MVGESVTSRSFANMKMREFSKNLKLLFELACYQILSQFASLSSQTTYKIKTYKNYFQIMV
jgi:hypothetical protein